MTAAVLYGKEQLQIEIVDVPKLGPGDVLVRVRAALTCGTDVKVFRRGYHARMITPPALFGHELAGDIVAMGDQVEGFRIGQRVMAARRVTVNTSVLSALCYRPIIDTGMVDFHIANRCQDSVLHFWPSLLPAAASGFFA